MADKQPSTPKSRHELPLLPKSSDERFPCTPYNAVLTGAQCVSRQGDAQQHRPPQRGEYASTRQRNDVTACRDCAHGRAVAASLQGESVQWPPPAQEPPTRSLASLLGDDECPQPAQPPPTALVGVVLHTAHGKRLELKPAPTPAPPDPEPIAAVVPSVEAAPMPPCVRPGCSRPQTKLSMPDDHPEVVGLCMQHRRAVAAHIARELNRRMKTSPSLQQVERARKLTPAQVAEVQENLEIVQRKVRSQVQQLAHAQGRATALEEALRVMVQYEKDEPHEHDVPATWDSDNVPEIRGKPCRKCVAFAKARALLGITGGPLPVGPHV